jgi:glutamate-ammonia-ligase adenylyltransferase
VTAATDDGVPQEIRDGPDPQAAGVRLQRFREQGGVVPGDAEGRRLLAAILSSGSFLPELLLADVAGWETLRADPWLRRPKPAARAHAEVEEATRGAGDFADFKRRLRLLRRREMLRLGARELGWGTTEEVAAELSGLADACLEVAVRFCDAALRAEYGQPVAAEADAPPPGFVVLAMGKLGGEELNYSSDVDLVYFYSTDAGEVVPPPSPPGSGGAGAGAAREPREPRSLHGYYTELSRRLTEAIEEPTAEGFLFRVDLRLRPEGRGGPLANSLAAAERYYESFGRTWERQALLRARAAAGDRDLGARILEMLDPFIYPRSIHPGMVDEIRELRGMFRPKREGPGDAFDVKLGTGGIRDVELVVQTLQLLHGGKRRDLRDRSTPGGLRRLLVAGLLRDREARTLAAAYRFWRQVEHRVQLGTGAQTHSLPADREARAVLARSLEFPDVDAFDAAVAARRRDVSAIADTFADPEPDLPVRVRRLLDLSLDRAELEAGLDELGFADREASADALEMVRARLPPALLAEAAASPDPDRTLAAFRDLALRGSVGLLALLGAEPQLRRMLATFFGTSERLSRTLVQHPSLWDPLFEGLGAPVRAPATMGAALDARLATAVAVGGADASPDELDELEGEEMRRFQTEEMLRIALHDVGGSIDVGAVSRQLSDLAEVCLVRGLDRVHARMVARHGRPAAALTVLGLGSLGAWEMRYGSDLDLVFLYSDEGQTESGADHREIYAQTARRLIGSFGAMLGAGRLYSVDTRLRPSGEQGLLVTSYRAFERYHQEQAAGWERVALLRARVVFTTAGAAERAALEEMLRRIAYHRPLDVERFRADTRRVRERVERERGRVLPGSRHLRFDPGGIMDVELLAALGQLEGGAADPGLCTTETTVALARLTAAAGWPATLGADYALLRTLAMRMRLLRDRPEDVVGPRDLPVLARTLERDPARLAAEIDAAMGRVRQLFVARF